MKLKKLKRAVIKEEFVAITGDYISAIILNQFLYWSDRVNDFDKMLAEEKRIAEKDGIELNMQPKHGWIYKKAEELIEETMIGISANCMRTKIKLLTSKGYLLERKNPCYKWDHTKQYRINFQKIQYDLHQQGYELEGYRITPRTLRTSEITETHVESYDVPPDEFRNSGDEFHSSGDEFHSSGDEFHSSGDEEQYQRLHSETTSINYVQREKPPRKTFGEYKNVYLSDNEYNQLKEEFPDGECESIIERVSEYQERMGKQYKNHFLTIRKWGREDKEKASFGSVQDTSYNFGTMLTIEDVWEG